MKTKMLPLIVLLLITSTCVCGEEYKALVIGVSNYDDKGITLQNATNDAQAVAEVLEERYKFNVVLLKGYVTHEDINRELGKLIRDSEKDQTVLIYYSGHGATGYWIPSDTQNQISNQDIINKINLMKSRSVLLISDSCYAGTFFSAKEPEKSECNDDQCYRWAMTSGSIERVNPKGLEKENISYFTYALVKELTENKEPEIKPGDIFPRIEKFVKKETAKSMLQTHLYQPIKGNRIGNFIFSASTQPLPAPRCDEKPFENEHGMTFIYMKPGVFFMGTPPNKPNTPPGEPDELYDWVRLSDFYIQTTEVTQEQWDAVMDTTPSFHKCKDCPVENISWDKVKEFIDKLNRMKDEKKPKGYKYDLPTEAQWEYACRAGTQTAFSTGDSITTEYANYNGLFPYFNCPKGENRQGTVEVRELPPNPWGIYGMHGNVWEWCKDYYPESTDKQSDRKRKDPVSDCTDNQSICEKRKMLIRGGAWSTDAKSCRCAHRAWAYRDDRGKSIGIGFRVVLVPR